MAGYCASKAFVLSLSEAVNYELKGTGVSVSTLCPGVTDTGFIERANAGKIFLDKYLLHAKASDVAEYGYKLMMKGRSVGIPGIFNKILANSSRFSSRSVIVAISGKMMKK
jgi:short-subunit dehydrogenase